MTVIGAPIGVPIPWFLKCVADYGVANNSALQCRQSRRCRNCGKCLYIIIVHVVLYIVLYLYIIIYLNITVHVTA